MIIVCEPVCQGLEHVAVNAAVLRMVRAAFREHRITVVAEREHSKGLRDALRGIDLGAIAWRDVDIPPACEILASNSAGIRAPAHAFPAGHGRARALAVTAQCARLDARRALRLPRTVSTPVPRSGDSSRDAERVETQEPACAGCGLALVDAVRCKAEAPIPRVRRRDEGTGAGLAPEPSGRVEAIPHPVPLGEGDDSSQIPEPPLRVGFLGLASDPDGFGIFLDMPDP